MLTTIISSPFSSGLNLCDKFTSNFLLALIRNPVLSLQCVLDCSGSTLQSRVHTLCKFPQHICCVCKILCKFSISSIKNVGQVFNNKELNPVYHSNVSLITLQSAVHKHNKQNFCKFPLVRAKFIANFAYPQQKTWVKYFMSKTFCLQKTNFFLSSYKIMHFYPKMV